MAAINLAPASFTVGASRCLIAADARTHSRLRDKFSKSSYTYGVALKHFFSVSGAWLYSVTILDSQVQSEAVHLRFSVGEKKAISTREYVIMHHV